MVVGLGRDLCERLAPEWLPDGVPAFAPMHGTDGAVLGADQHDLWIWLHGGGPDGVFDEARQATAALGGLTTLAREQACFTYQASQDLTGFEDGTENPPLDEAVGLVQVPAGAGAGSSVVLLQRWVHDLDAFDALDADARDRCPESACYVAPPVEAFAPPG